MFFFQNRAPLTRAAQKNRSIKPWPCGMRARAFRRPRLPVAWRAGFTVQVPSAFLFLLFFFLFSPSPDPFLQIPFFESPFLPLIFLSPPYLRGGEGASYPLEFVIF